MPSYSEISTIPPNENMVGFDEDAVISLLPINGPLSATVIPFDQDFPRMTLDISATNRNFQTGIIIKQSSSRSGLLSFLEEKLENENSPPTRTPGTGVRPSYGGQ